MAVLNRLVGAVLQRRAVRLRYVGTHATGERLCHPHVVYRSSGGTVLLDAVQVEGDSASGEPSGWKAFEVEFIQDLQILDERFEPDPGLNLDNRVKYSRVVAHCHPAPRAE